MSVTALERTKNKNMQITTLLPSDLAPLPALPDEYWAVEVSPMINSKKWLRKHGLHRNRLTMKQILAQVGFKHSTAFVGLLEKPVSSNYGEKLFKRFKSKDGKSYNITVSKRILHEIRENLIRAEHLFQQRLKWLTTGSRQIFGVIEERSVSIVLNTTTQSQEEFSIYIQSLCCLIRDQITKLARFNLIRSQTPIHCWQEGRSVPVTNESINDAINWLMDLQPNTDTSKICCLDAVMTAMKDDSAEAVYLFTEGDSMEVYRELFRHKLKETSRPLHIVSFNAAKSSTVVYLKEVAHDTNGRFHAFATTHECEKAITSSCDDVTNRGSELCSLTATLPLGGVPAGAGVRDDVFTIWEECEECRRNLNEIDSIISEVPVLKREECVIETPDPQNRQEHLLSSKEWLKRHGLKKLGLTAYQVLASNSFRHADGVVDVKTKSSNQNISDAENLRKLVNAKYCDKFAHAQWKDGTVVHVHVTAEQHKRYEHKMKIALDKIRRRIHWLQQGSREVFGTVLEEQVYLLLDTSHSMQEKMPILKEKVFQLLQEQIRHKKKFNIVRFDTKAVAWKEKLQDVSDNSLIDAWHWVKEIEVGGSTNTLAALRIALQDVNTHAIYLLTDGRPDQPDHVLWNCLLQRTQKILTEVQLRHQIPVHTIAFNCNDLDACRFLHQLSNDTGGRYHNFNGDPNLSEVVQPYESEDVSLLKRELEQGEFDLEKVSQLRTRCVTLDWYYNKQRHNLTPRYGEETTIISLSPKIAQASGTEDSSCGKLPRPIKCSSSSVMSMRNNTSQSSRSLIDSEGPQFTEHRTHRSMVTSSARPNTAAHTRTSILRFKSTRTRDLDGWILPETRKMLETQLRRSAEACYDIRRMEVQKQTPVRRTRRRSRKNPLDISNTAWLKTNSIAARRLTVMDALAPTVIRFTPKYVPVLDNYVSSKVFDDILPIAHLSSSGNKKLKSEMKLVNPSAVNFTAYQQKVQNCINEYEERLNLQITRNLSQDDVERFDSKPVSYLDNKEAVNQCLDRAGWPITEKEIQLLVDEIKLGEKYLQQSKDVQQLALEATTKKKNNSNKSVRDNSISGKKEKGSKIKWRKVYSSSSNSSHQKETTGPEIETAVEKTEDESSDDTSHSSSSSSEVSTARKSHKPMKKKARNQRRPESSKGMKAIARDGDDGFYYEARIMRRKDNRHLVMDFDHAGRAIVSNRHVIPRSGAISCPPLKVGDYVLCWSLNDSRVPCFVPGMVIGIPIKSQVRDKFYTLLKFNNNKTELKRKEIIKISASDYEFALRYVRFAQKIDRNAPSVDFIRNDERKSDLFKMVESNLAEVQNQFSALGGKLDINVEHQMKHRYILEKLYQRLMKGSAKEFERIREQLRQDREELNSRLDKHKEELSTQVEIATVQNSTVDGGTENTPTEVTATTEKTENVTRSSSSSSSSRITTEDNRTQESEDRTWMEKSSQTDTVVATSVTNITADGEEQDKSTDKTSSESEAETIQNKENEEEIKGIKEGDEVIARHKNSGFYYRGTIHASNSGHVYEISNCSGHVKKTARCDVITDEDDANCELHVDGKVLGLHPYLVGFFGPAVIKSVTNQEFNLLYFDGLTSTLPREKVFMISEEKYQEIVHSIEKCKNKWLGETVVARNDNSGIYQLGLCKKLVGSYSYELLWADGSVAVQESPLMFGALSDRRHYRTGDHVIAMMDYNKLKYLPGQIVQDENGDKVIEFCNDIRIKWLPEDAKFSYLISEEFYRDATSFFKSRQKLLNFVKTN